MRLPLISNLLSRFRSKRISYCPVCKRKGEFLPFGVVKRPHAQCPHCKSLERHRLLWLYLERETDFFHAHIRVLDVAPTKFLQDIFYALPNMHYTSVDQRSVIAMEKMDLTDLAYPDNTFDCILCYHVLEHIPDDRKAMSEVLRVLKPGGFAILQVPVDYSRERTYEDPSIVTPEDREKHFRQWDHVRIYGRDYPDRLKGAGFDLERRAYAQELGSVMITRCGLRAQEILHICRKP